MNDSSKPIVRPAQEGDAAAIIELYLEGQRPNIAELTAMGCPGGVGYVAALIAESELGGSQRFWVAEETDGTVFGFVHIKRDPDDVCVNNLFVRSASHRKGYGSLLYLEGLSWEACLVPTIVSDVFQDNEISRPWNDRLGYVAESERTWLVGPLPSAAGGTHWLDGLPQAEAVHERFGFSMFQVLTPDGRYNVGRLGSGWFRLPSPDALDDDGLLAALNRLDSARRVLVVSQTGRPRQGRAADLDMLAVGVRMRVPREVIVERLSRK